MDVDERSLEADVPRLEAGTLFAGRYRIRSFLGEGQRKHTYLACDTTLSDRRVALALVKPAAMQSDPEATRRETAALVQSGNHDNIVTLHDSGVCDGVEYLVIAYLCGGTLKGLLKARSEQGNPPSVDEVMQWGRQLARALSHTHQNGLVHRDVASGNVWLDERMVAHLGDFDSAVPYGAQLAASALPPTTQAYAPPEQIEGGAPDRRSDLYSLGALLYEALVGKIPPRGNAVAIARALDAKDPVIPRRVRTLLCRMLAEDPDDRPASADEVLRELQSARPAGSGVEAWMRSMPFPVAGILQYYVGELAPAGKIDYLLKFFESFAQFTATIQASVLLPESPSPPSPPSPLLPQAGLSPHSVPRTRPDFAFNLTRASFGGWVKLAQKLGAIGRAALADSRESAAHFVRLFGTSDPALADALTDPRLTGMLYAACELRNAWVGHGGVASERLQGERLAEIERLLGELRRAIGTVFEAWTLLKPTSMTFERGLFEVNAAVLTGPSPAFSKTRIRLSHPTDTSRLYLFHDGGERALELVPLIRLMSGSRTGQQACYVYSCVQGERIRWISYHCHEEPELVQCDPETLAFVTRLAGAAKARPIEREA